MDPDTDLNPKHCLTGSNIPIIFSKPLFFAVIIYVVFEKILKKTIFFPSRRRQQLSWGKWWREQEAGRKH
jgi:hypothetical protein